MSFSALLTQTASVVSRAVGAADSEGNTVPGATTTTDYPARLQQTEATDVVAGEQRVLSEYLLFLPASAVVGQDAEVVVSGARYQVIGRPDVVHGRRGAHHIEARLRRAS